MSGDELRCYEQLQEWKRRFTKLVNICLARYIRPSPASFLEQVRTWYESQRARAIYASLKKDLRRESRRLEASQNAAEERWYAPVVQATDALLDRPTMSGPFSYEWCVYVEDAYGNFSAALAFMGSFFEGNHSGVGTPQPKA